MPTVELIKALNKATEASFKFQHPIAIAFQQTRTLDQAHLDFRLIERRYVFSVQQIT
jgi:hypothetical protein